jgi:UDP-glucose 4-epimerase
MAHVLITGATGAVGPSVVRAFAAAGHRVRILARQGSPTADLPSSIDVARGDITSARDLNSAVSDAHCVVHLAALLHVTNPPPSLVAEYQRVNVDATRQLVEACLSHGVQRLVFASTIAVYGDTKGRTLRESDPVNPDTAYARSKRDAESVVLGAQTNDRGCLGTVLRLAAVYGPRVKGNYRTLLDALARRRFVGVGSGRNRRSLIHERDVGLATVTAATASNAAGRIYNVSDGEPHTVSQIISAMCEALGRRPPRLNLPVAVARWGLRAIELGYRSVGGRHLHTQRALAKYLEDAAVDASLIQRELGFRPTMTLVSGWTDTVMALQTAGELRSR